MNRAFGEPEIVRTKEEEAAEMAAQRSFDRLRSKLYADGLLTSDNKDPKPIQYLDRKSYTKEFVIVMNDESRRKEVDKALADWTWEKRKPRTVDSIDNDLAALPQARLIKMFRRRLAEMIHDDPALALRLGELIAGDEPEDSPLTPDKVKKK